MNLKTLILKQTAEEEAVSITKVAQFGWLVYIRYASEVDKVDVSNSNRWFYAVQKVTWEE